MKILIKTKVNSNYKSILSRFDLKLFKELKPPLMPLEIERFDGCKLNDEVHLLVGPFKQRWVSVVTKNIENASEASFVDEGKHLPFPITTWSHYHRIEYISESESYIIDDISYKCSNIALSYLMYPLFYLQFYMRKNVYKNFFKVKS